MFRLYNFDFTCFCDSELIFGMIDKGKFMKLNFNTLQTAYEADQDLK